MEQKHGMALFEDMAAEFKTAIESHDVQELERLGRAFIAEFAYKKKRFSQCGKSNSQAKIDAAKLNGIRGGRPRKSK